MYAWPKFHGSSPYSFQENDLNTKKVYADEDDDDDNDAGKAVHMSRFCFAGETKMERDCCEFICGAPMTFQAYGIE